MAETHESTGERTKVKAMLRYIAERQKAYTGADISEEKINAVAALVKSSHSTVPTRYDRRFPNTNQAGACWTAFNEYQICVSKREKKDPLCLQRGRDYATLCPVEWIDKWKEQRDAGNMMSVGTAFVDDE